MTSPVGRRQPLTAVFGAELSALRERIALLRRGEAPPGDLTSLLLQDLQTAQEELRVADEELRAQQEELEVLLHGYEADRALQERLHALLPVAALVTDAQGAIRTANTAAAALLHVGADRLLGKPLQVFVDGSDRPAVRRALSRAVADRSELRQVVTLRPRDRVPVEVELLGTVRQDPWNGTVDVTWVVLSAGASPRSEESDLRLSLTRALVQLVRLPLHRRSAAEAVRLASAVCGNALGPSLQVSVTLDAPGEGAPGEGAPSEGAPSDEAPEPGGTAPDVLALPLRIGDRPVGALRVQADAGAALGEEVREGARLLSTAVSAVLQELDTRQELELLAAHLRTALTSRAVIDQAKGVVMATQGCSPEEAFDYLARLSSDRNVKLRDLAARVVELASQGTLLPPG